MKVTVLLGGHLGNEAVAGPRERTVEVPEGSCIGDIANLLGLPEERLKLIMLNGKGALTETKPTSGDRVALFPPELAYNTFVSLSFRKEFVEKRTKPHGDENP